MRKYNGIHRALGGLENSLASSGSRPLPKDGLLIYLARPNSDGYVTPENSETPEDLFDWGYYLPNDSDIRSATGWTSGVANVFYSSNGVPVVCLATDIVNAQPTLPTNVLFKLKSAILQTGKLAIYATGTSEDILNQAEEVLGI